MGGVRRPVDESGHGEKTGSGSMRGILVLIVMTQVRCRAEGRTSISSKWEERMQRNASENAEMM